MFLPLSLTFHFLQPFLKITNLVNFFLLNLLGDFCHCVWLRLLCFLFFLLILLFIKKFPKLFIFLLEWSHGSKSSHFRSSISLQPGLCFILPKDSLTQSHIGFRVKIRGLGGDKLRQDGLLQGLYGRHGDVVHSW